MCAGFALDQKISTGWPEWLSSRGTNSAFQREPQEPRPGRTGDVAFGQAPGRSWDEKSVRLRAPASARTWGGVTTRLSAAVPEPLMGLHRRPAGQAGVR